MLARLSCLLCAVAAAAAASPRWSRQVGVDFGDWMPVPGPAWLPEPAERRSDVKRQVAQPRILAEPVFPRHYHSMYMNPAPTRQIYLQPVPSAPQNYLDFGSQRHVRFGANQQLSSMLSGFENAQKLRPVAYQSAPVSPQPAPFTFDKPKFDEAPLKGAGPRVPSFVDGYQLDEFIKRPLQTQTQAQTQALPHAQSLQRIKFEDSAPLTPPTGAPKSEREEIQLVYVPVETLNKKHGPSPVRDPPTFKESPPVFGRDGHGHHALIQPHFTDMRKPQHSLLNYDFGHSLQPGFNARLPEFDQVPRHTTVAAPFLAPAPVTPKPKKLKPHQPPLAVFLAQEARKGSQVKVSDVLSSLKNAKSIAVLDAVDPQRAPKVFIGPSFLVPPENYVKFELPYLSNIENSDRKLRQLPFFVAPLSYNTPDGFAKIPFPSPHVGSVIVNSQVRDAVKPQAPLTADVIPNSYSGNVLKQEKPAQKPQFTYYTTASPNTNTQQAVTSNYYSFEPQTVTSLGAKPDPHSNIPLKTHFNVNKPQFIQQQNRGQYEQNFPLLPALKRTTTPSNEVTRENYQQSTESYGGPTLTSVRQSPTNTPPPATYPSQLLETHNPYSINQAFHLSTPLDQTYNEEDSTPGGVSPPPAPSSTFAPEQAFTVTTEKPASSTQHFTKETSQETEAEVMREVHPFDKKEVTNSYEGTTATTQRPRRPTLEDRPSRNRFPSSEYQDIDSTSTKRAPIRPRGRPRPTPRQRDGESTTDKPVERPTRRPLLSRKPLPERTERPRSRYEPNRITSDKPTRKPNYSDEDLTTKAARGERITPTRRPVENSDEDTTTKVDRSRSRGRVQFKGATDNEHNDYENVSENKGKSKEDLAYQRDVLHQNYPVTLMERMSTAVDIEAITDPVPRPVSTVFPTTEVFQAESEQSIANERGEEDEWSRPEAQTESFVSSDPRQNGDFMYFTKGMSALAPAAADDSAEISKFATKSESSKEVAGDYSKYTKVNEFFSNEELTTQKEIEVSTEKVEETPQTTQAPQLHRIRMRPGRLQVQTSSTESSKTTTRPETRKRPAQPVTYRPAYDRRRTTMRIEEIETELKTKSVNGRPEQEYRHPVYRPEPTPPPSATLSYSETTTKRGQFRRRRPSYSTTTESGEKTTKKSVYEVKSRFKGRRTTEKPIEKTETEKDITSTVRSVPHSRYARPRLSEKYNKRPAEKDEDQETNYSIKDPRFAIPEEKTDEWSKYTVDSFKPYNPNEIAEDRKTTERRPETDIITARNDYEELLFPVTPASNKLNEPSAEVTEATKVPVVTEKTTFESMIEEVMKNLEEQDEHEYQAKEYQGNEYQTKEYQTKETEAPAVQVEVTTDAATTPEPVTSSPATEDQKPPKQRRRGFWKKVKVRPVTTESLTAAESQYYTNTVNHLGDPVQENKLRKPETKVTTYKPSMKIPEIPVTVDEEDIDKDLLADIVKIRRPESVKLVDDAATVNVANDATNANVNRDSVKENKEVKETTTASPGELDLGTGTPDPTVMDMFYNPTTTEPSDTGSSINRSDGFSFIDYLFGVTAPEETKTERTTERVTETTDSKKDAKTTEATFVPEEMTTTVADEDETPSVDFFEIQKVTVTERAKVENKTEETPAVTTSSYMNPDAVLSTSMSTEISHETEICFRGKCIKTKKNIL